MDRLSVELSGMILNSYPRSILVCKLWYEILTNNREFISAKNLAMILEERKYNNIGSNCYKVMVNHCASIQSKIYSLMKDNDWNGYVSTYIGGACIMWHNPSITISINISPSGIFIAIFSILVRSLHSLSISEIRRFLSLPTLNLPLGKNLLPSLITIASDLGVELME